ncbi:MAG: nucleoside deaminase [Pseudomonadota bacterium]
MNANAPLPHSGSGSDPDSGYLAFSMVKRRNFLAAAAAATAVGMGTGAAHAADPPVDPPVRLGGARGVTSVITDQDRIYMREAIRVMRQVGVIDRSAFPFGAVIVRDGKVIATSGNTVWKDRDPTAHAEINAIREACRVAGSTELAGAILYTSCECCPMCYAAAYFARIDKIFYAAGWRDAGFPESNFNVYDDMTRPYPQRVLAPEQMLQEEGKAVWDEFRKLPEKR